MAFARLEVMRIPAFKILVLGFALAAACGEDQARCGAEACAGPAGLPCRCGGVGSSSGPSKGSAEAGGTATPAAAGAGGGDVAHADLALLGTPEVLNSLVQVKVHETIDLTLQTIGPGEYGEPQLSSTAVVFDGTDAASPPNPGGPRQIYRFHAEAPGTVLVTIPHSEGRAEFTLTFDVT